MHEPTALNQLAREFAAWRNNRNGTKATPAALKRQAVKLRSSYRVSHLIHALGINYSTLKRWVADESATPTPEFIALPMAPPAMDTPSALCGTTSPVLCELPNGVRLTLDSQALNHTLLSTLSQLNTEATS